MRSEASSEPNKRSTSPGKNESRGAIQFCIPFSGDNNGVRCRCHAPFEKAGFTEVAQVIFGDWFLQESKTKNIGLTRNGLRQQFAGNGRLFQPSYPHAR